MSEIKICEEKINHLLTQMKNYLFVELDTFN